MNDREKLVRLLRGELPESESNELRRALESDAQLAAEYRRVRRMHDVLRAGVADSFAPYFSDRVIKKLMTAAAAPRAVFYESMQWVFLRLAAASLLVVIGLGAYNAIDSQDSDLAASTVEAVFGLPSPDLDNLFYLQGI